MRLAIVSDIHGNLTAFEAVLEHLRMASADVVLHGGDLADGGSGPVEIIDRIRDLGWRGVIGNTDEMLAAPETLESFASGSPALKPMFDIVREMAAWTRDRAGADRIAWLGALPPQQQIEDIVLVHASPNDRWRAPGAQASDDELTAVYGELGAGLAVYGHIHRPFVRRGVANSGSAGLPYDGDPRASYLLITDGVAEIQRVAYDVEAERTRLAECGLPHGEWVGRTLAAGAFQPL